MTLTTSKQTTLVNTWTVSQRSIDKAVVKYVVQGLLPFCVAEQEPFQDFVKELLPNAKIMSWLTLCSMTDDASKEMKVVTEAMRELTILPPPTTAGLSEGGASLVLPPTGLTLTVSKVAQQP